MNGARDRLEAARRNIGTSFTFVAVHEAYYAMLYAARAALSEEDRYAKTQAGPGACSPRSSSRPDAFHTSFRPR